VPSLPALAKALGNSGDGQAPPAGWAASFHREPAMTIHLELVPLLSLAAGITILVVPKILNYVVAAYLIAVGVLGLIH
jgi:hypothetical protein